MTAEKSHPHLVGIQGLVAGTRFAVNNPLITIGRDDYNDIALAEASVSLHHATILRSAAGSISIQDESSEAGVFVNNIRVHVAVLADGDIITIGDNHFRFEA